ncbi:AMIN-like domain-containing (lipo)protein [Micromonospora sp. NPDC003776]
MTPQRVPLLAGVVVLLAAACTTTDHDGATTAPSTAPAPSATAAATPPAATPAASSTAPAATTATPPAAGDWRMTYGWAVPTSPARVTHRVRVPVTPAPGEPLPVLVRIEVGDHPAEGYSRITFAFRGPTPSYQVAYVPRVESDGSGAPVSLPGNAFLAVRFEPAQTHDSAGRSTVSAPPRTIGYPTLRGWAPAGDFEGYVTVGLGVQAPGGRLPVRLGESTRPDGTHVVSLDVRRS